MKSPFVAVVMNMFRLPDLSTAVTVAGDGLKLQGRQPLWRDEFIIRRV
jgi:hypothetical protein